MSASAPATSTGSRSRTRSRRPWPSSGASYPNVDFYAASVYHALGIPTDLMTPIFALARMAGWTAHVREQYADNKVIRPGSEYVGPKDRTYTPIDER